MSDSETQLLPLGLQHETRGKGHNEELKVGEVDPAYSEAQASEQAGFQVRRGRGRRRWAGAPERRSRVVPFLLVGAVGLGVIAGVVARGFVSPAQVAASAKPPPASLITAKVRFGILPVVVTLRANVANGHPIQVHAPGNLAGALPVVTSADVSSGQYARDGQLLITVAEQPVFVFTGVIPAFRTMSLGIKGPDVSQLQAGLVGAGFGIGADATGIYGLGTAAAVAALYKADGVTAESTGSPAMVARLTRTLGTARMSLSRARIRLAAAKKDGASQSVLAADRATVSSTESRVTADSGALAAAEKVTGAEIPLGAVMFLPHLPIRVLSVDKVGTTIASGSPALELGSGRVTLTSLADGAQVSLLRAGMPATAISDLSGARFPIRILTVRGQKVVFVPTGRVPAGVAGQNVEVTVTTSRVRTLIVPVAAVSTGALGQTYVTVSAGRGRTVQVPVRLGVSTGGEQAVSPRHAGQLRPGEYVALGIGAAR